MKFSLKKLLAQSYLWLLILIIYSPIFIIIVFSFTETKVLGNWTGFSLQLYRNIFDFNSNSGIMNALYNTLFIAFIASLGATLLGTISAIGIFNLKRKLRNTISFFNSIPIINPDIITGISLFLLFVWLGVSKGYATVILSHITFCVPYVVLSVMPRLKTMNPNIYEAAIDLGATPKQALWKVVFPEIRPAVITGFILSFTLSIDDFAVSLFTKGNIGLETLSTYIYSDTRRGGLTPELRPLSALIFIVVLVLLLVLNSRKSKAE
ncbi:MAG TPA: putrescine aminotransferase [Porphyromonadaceae bacterium]|nr:putrescine aminotransferase [Porphyromonadaceae bacterium]